MQLPCGNASAWHDTLSEPPQRWNIESTLLLELRSWRQGERKLIISIFLSFIQHKSPKMVVFTQRVLHRRPCPTSHLLKEFLALTTTLADGFHTALLEYCRTLPAPYMTPTKGLFTSWIMKSFKALKILWLVVQLVPGALRFTPSNKIDKVTMKAEVPTRRILRPTICTIMVQWVLWWERQRGAMIEKGRGPWQRNIFITTS